MTERNKKTARRKARNRRVVMTVALMLVVCIASIGGTIAWLTDSTETVQNTFSPSNIDIDLTETLPGNNTAKMVPGKAIDKNPQVTVEAGSEACWVFVTIKETDATYPENGTISFDDLINYEVIDTAAEAGKGKPYWMEYAEHGLTDGTKVYYYQAGTLEDEGTVAADITLDVIGYTKDGVFTANKVLTQDTVTKEMMNNLQKEGATNPKLSFKAYAIQQSSFATVDAAWTEVKKSVNWD